MNTDNTSWNVTPRTQRGALIQTTHSATSRPPRSGGARALRLFGNKAMVAACLLGGALPPSLAQEFKPDYGKVMAEITRATEQDSKHTLVMWFPQEFWRASMEKATHATPSQKQAAIKMFEEYLVVAVCRYDVGPFGGYNFEAEPDTRGHLVLVDGKGQRYQPLAYGSVSPDFQNLLSFIKPLMENALGRFGKNVNFYVFPGKSRSGHIFCKASEPGSFTIQVEDTRLTWRLPLGSLLPAKSCPRCGDQLSGAFSYCPYDATALVEPTPGGTLSARAPLQAAK